MVRLSVSTLALWDIRDKYKEKDYAGSHDEIIKEIQRAEEEAFSKYGLGRVSGVEFGLLPWLVNKSIIDTWSLNWWANLPYNTIHGVYDKERGMNIEEEKKWYKRLEAKNIVYHPDAVSADFLKMLLDNFETVSVENMDNQKKFGGTVEDLEKTFEEYPNLKMTLDINHSATPEVTGKMIDSFESRIIEIHCSGVNFKGDKKRENALTEHVPVAFDSDSVSLENLALVHRKLPNVIYVIESELVKDRKKNIALELRVVNNYSG